MDEDADFYWEDRQAVKSLTGKYANRIYVQPVGDGMLRINFGELLDDEPTYHSAIVVSAQHAMEFANLIYNIGDSVAQAAAEAVKQAIEAAEAAAKAAGDVEPPTPAPIVVKHADEENGDPA